ncbi:MAG: hypothetical protein QM710_04885 [Flavobacterium sp.]
MPKSMKGQPLHIISFENPFPADYGGAIDVFYKVRALHEIGFEIHLHCFTENRFEVAPELKECTKQVYIYRKNKNPFFFFSKFPVPVVCRFRPELISNISKTAAPILFDGLQTTMVLHKAQLANKKFLRLHNIESDFYAGMSRNETNYFKKMVYHFAGKKYLAYQKILPSFDHVFTLSCYENDFVKTMMDEVTYVPVFHGNEKKETLSEYGKFALYHGDLRLADNKNAAKFLIKVFKKIPDYKLVIASSNGKKMVEKRIGDLKNVEFVELQNSEQLDGLFREAHINVMLSFQKSGTKLKLVNALFKSRFCLVNENMIDDADVLKFCKMANSKEEFIANINMLKEKPFLDIAERTIGLNGVLSDKANAMLMAGIIGSDTNN